MFSAIEPATDAFVSDFAAGDGDARASSSAASVSAASSSPKSIATSPQLRWMKRARCSPPTSGQSQRGRNAGMSRRTNALRPCFFGTSSSMPCVIPLLVISTSSYGKTHRGGLVMISAWCTSPERNTTRARERSTRSIKRFFSFGNSFQLSTPSNKPSTNFCVSACTWMDEPMITTSTGSSSSSSASMNGSRYSRECSSDEEGVAERASSALVTPTRRDPGTPNALSSHRHWSSPSSSPRSALWWNRVSSKISRALRFLSRPRFRNVWCA
mmetsp:Transcript_3906/g.16616  ORF Transcript_3906/g.16616 Transcript_3906/m.16616 type:complete len:270 (-) Transcript_3906:726-1535(-)